MKFVMFGFEFVFGFKPTTETKIRYVNWLTKRNHIRCRMFHDSTWVPTRHDNIRRWFYCRDCKYAWTEKMTGCGDKV